MCIKITSNLLNDMLKAALKLPFSPFGRLREPLTFGSKLDMLDFLMLIVFFPGIFRVTSSKYSDMFSTAFTPSSGDCCWCSGIVELLHYIIFKKITQQEQNEKL